MFPKAEAAGPSLGQRRSLFRPRRTVRAVVVHTTGAGLIQRWRRESGLFPNNTPVDTAVRVYTKIMKPAPHYIVGQDGRVVHVTDENLAAWHVGSSKGWRYTHKDWDSRPVDKGRYAWWKDRWPLLDSPRSLAGGKLWLGGQCNPNTIGIEVPPPEDDTSGQWSPECYSSLRELLGYLCDEYGLPREPEYLVGHSDAHPLARTTTRGLPWDPHPSQWTPEVCRALFA